MLHAQVFVQSVSTKHVHTCSIYEVYVNYSLCGIYMMCVHVALLLTDYLFTQLLRIKQKVTSYVWAVIYVGSAQWMVKC